MESLSDYIANRRIVNEPEPPVVFKQKTAAMGCTEDSKLERGSWSHEMELKEELEIWPTK